MRKSNITTTLILCGMMILALILSLKPDEKTEGGSDVAFTETDIQKEESKPIEKAPLSIEKSLFIGDSRAVGLMEYSQLKMDFFCNVGMSVFNIYNEVINVPDVGKMTLQELLDYQKYDCVYVMLGINEMGYPFESIIKKYQELLLFIKEKEPDACIIIQANLHVTKKRSSQDDIYNNTAINRLNHALSGLANQEDVFYFDVNPLFDDEAGNLSADKSFDQTHLYAKYYVDWGQWITSQTALLTKEN